MNIKTAGRAIGAMLIYEALAIGVPPRAVAATPLIASHTQEPAVEDFSIAAVGDLLQVRPILPQHDQRFEAVVALLRQADVAFGNGEMPLLDLARFGGYPAAENGGSDAYGSVEVAADWRGMGLLLISRANNHATDWGVEGMNFTDHVLDAAGLVHAGTGPNLSAARRAPFVETLKGRVALAAVTTNFTKSEPAGTPLGEIGGRPGASVLHATSFIHVEQAAIDALKKFYGDSVYRPGETKSEAANEVTIQDQKFRAASKAGLDYEPNQDDLREILQAVKQGKQAADFLAFSIHSHEGASGIENDVPLAEFVEDLAHEAIDAGADIVFGHGPHQVGGIEIYKGRPIFYSLGDFTFQLDLQEGIYPEGWTALNLDPSSTTPVEYWAKYIQQYFSKPEFWHSIVAVTRYRHGKLTEIKLYPLDLGFGQPASRRGVPHFAAPDVGRRILERIQHLSERFHTAISIINGVGVIRLHP